MDQRESLQSEVGKRGGPFFDFCEFQRISLGIDPMAVNSPELIIKFAQPRWSDKVEGKRADEIRGIVGGEEKGDEIGHMVGMKVGKAKKVDFSEIQPEPGHLTKGAAAPVKEKKVAGKSQNRPGRAALSGRDAGARS